MKRRNFLAATPAIAAMPAAAAPVVQMHENDLAFVSPAGSVPVVLRGDGTIQTLAAFTPMTGDIYTVEFPVAYEDGDRVLLTVRRSLP